MPDYTISLDTDFDAALQAWVVDSGSSAVDLLTSVSQGSLQSRVAEAKATATAELVDAFNKASPTASKADIVQAAADAKGNR